MQTIAAVDSLCTPAPAGPPRHAWRPLSLTRGDRPVICVRCGARRRTVADGDGRGRSVYQDRNGWTPERPPCLALDDHFAPAFEARGWALVWAALAELHMQRQQSAAAWLRPVDAGHASYGASHDAASRALHRARDGSDRCAARSRCHMGRSHELYLRAGRAGR